MDIFIVENFLLFRGFMKRSFGVWGLWGVAVVSVLGTLFHFLYEWVEGQRWASFVATFSGVNESTWEHMKLFFFPAFLFGVIEWFFFKDIDCFWCIKLRGILCGLILIPVIFYTYNGVIGKSPDWVNITIFFVAVIIAYIYETRLFKENDIRCKYSKLCFLALLVIGVLFIVFTYFTPTLEIFRDPISGSFGI